MMSTKTKTITIVSLVIILTLGGLYYLGTRTPVVVEDQTGAVIDSQPSQEVPSYGTITGKHQYKNGNHFVVGEVNVPTPCHIVTTTVQIAQSYPEQVTIHFVAATSGEVCAQVITPVRFRAEFKASSQAVIKATWNGQPVVLNLIPVSSDENLENFEMYFKG